MFPAYVRHYASDDTSFSDHVFVPVQALFSGRYWVTPLAGQWAINPQAGRILVSQETTWYTQSSLLIQLLEARAVLTQIEGHQRHHRPIDQGSMLKRSAEYMQAALDDWDHWHFGMVGRDERIAEVAPVVGELTIAAAPARDFVDIDPTVWRTEFRIRYADARCMLINVLDRADHDELIARLDGLADSESVGDFDFSAAEWARFFVAFLKACRQAPSGTREAIAEMMCPPLQTRVISFYNEMEGCSVADMRSAIREQSNLVLAERSRQLAHERTVAALRQRLFTPIQNPSFA